MCSSARSPSGSRTPRVGGSRGRVRRRPEGRVRGAARAGVPGVGGLAGLVLQVASRRWLTATGAAASPVRADRGVVRPPPGHLRGAQDHRGSARDGLAGQPEHRRRADGRTGPARPRETPPPEHHTSWSGPLACPGPGQPGLHRPADQPALVRRWHRDQHRRGQAAAGQRAGCVLATHPRVRLERASRRRAGLRLAGDGGRGARRPGPRGGATHRPGQRTRIQAVVATPRHGGE